MPRHSGVFPEINRSQAGIPEDVTPEFMRGGFNSGAFRIGSRVVKVTTASTGLEQAGDLLATMEQEHAILHDSIGDYMPETRYTVAEETAGDGARVVTVQPFIEGVSLWDYLNIPSNPTDELREFLRQCRQVYRKNRLMPDICNVETAFNVYRTPNVRISDDDQRPVLVDTTFGKTQRLLGPVWNRAIYGGSLLASARLALDTRKHASLTSKRSS